MPLIKQGHDLLPQLDANLPDAQLEAARAAIAAERGTITSTSIPMHPDLPKATYTPQFSSLMATAHEQIAATGKARQEDQGVSLDRYEEPEPPAGAETAEELRRWRATLRAAYTSQSYLAQRALNLSLLERYGKNAWLIGNSQLEDELRALELELKAAREQGFALDEERKQRQDAVRGELEALRTSWQESLGRAIEAEVAGAQLQQQILDARRAGAGA